MPNVSIATSRGTMPAYLAVPDGSAQAGGVVVIHDVGGMSVDHRAQADWLAEAGFLALAIDLYYLGGLFHCVRTIMRDAAARSGPTFDDIEAARQWLVAQPGCNGRIGVIGFCMGGGFALMLVSDHGFSAASINYGGHLPKDVATFLRGACPIVGSYGAKDHWNKGVATQLEVLLAQATIPHDVKEYPEAGHSFMNRHERQWFKLLRWVNIAFDEPAALDARHRIAFFFRLHLEGAKQADGEVAEPEGIGSQSP